MRESYHVFAMVNFVRLFNIDSIMCHAVPDGPHETFYQVWEVVKVDPAVGGSVVLKGGANNLTEAERSETWSQFGLSLLGNATLM